MDNNLKIVTGVSVLAVAGLGVGLGLAWPLSSGGPVTGTETFAGTVQMTPAQLAASTFVPTIPLKASGVFADTGSIYLAPGSGKDGNGPGPASIKLAAGNVNVHHAATGSDQQPVLVGPASACVYGATDHVAYTVTGGTGAYANVTGGKGIATVTFTFTMPKLAVNPHVRPAGGATACNTGSSALPLAGSVSFSAVGSITLSSAPVTAPTRTSGRAGVLQ